jgi:hypothetical protein
LPASYKQKFSDSSDKAHTRFIATKIYQDMEKHRASVETSPTTSRRWVWELIQNAKDVNIDGKVRVRIDSDLEDPDAHVTFSHSGGAFTTENIRFLIEQVSSKERTKDSTGRPTATGRFGTGFLTTHLLSETVTVNGVVQEDDLTPRQFELSLDRSGNESNIIVSVAAAKQSMDDLDDLPPYKKYVDGAFNTSFRYELADDTGKKVARAGFKDLDVCLPYTLAFVSAVESVNYQGHLVSLQEPDEERADGEVQFLSVTSVDGEGETESSSLAVLSLGLTTIAIAIELTDDGARILPLRPQVPRLFCDFPLLGTESFPFPVIINNPTFNPTEPRDGVILTKNERSGTECDENRTIIEEAYALYQVLLDHASTNEWENLHLLAAAKPMPAFEWTDQKWYTAEILKPMQATLLQKKIVRTAADTVEAIRASDGTNNIWFPSNTNPVIRRRIWRCCSTWVPHWLPAKPDVDAWYEIIWPECKRLTLDEVARLIEEDDTIEKLDGELAEGVDVYEWLNEFYKTLKLSDQEFLSVVAKRRIFPNQNGTFKKKAELARDAGDIDAALLDILRLLGTDLRDLLLDPAIDTVLDDLPQRDGGFVVNQITAAVSKIINDQNAMDQRRPALSALLVWFHQHPKSAKKLFPNLYEQRHRLIDDETMIENAKQADQLKQILTQFKMKDVDALQAVLEKHAAGSQLLPITEKIIASLGITSLKDWERALEDQDLAALYGHQSMPTKDMFILAQSYIKKAKARVTAHLKTLDEYDLTDIEEIATTVYAGVKHDGRDVYIVVRPAYDGTVIIYYQSEKDTLDYVEHELWVDTGTEVKRITFGHILKKNAIRRFPI